MPRLHFLGEKGLRWIWNGAGDDKFSRWVFLHAKEVRRFEVTNQFAGILALQIAACDGSHVQFKRTTSNGAVINAEAAGFNFHVAGVLTSDFVPGPDNVAGSRVNIVICRVDKGHNEKSGTEEKKQFFHVLEMLMLNNGSIQNIPGIPQDLKNLYKTVWEISQKAIIDMAADRGAFICQSQSLNVFIPNANFAKLSSMHFYAWKKGLKTGMYYLRTKAAVDAIKFTVDSAYLDEASGKEAANSMPKILNEVALAEVSCSIDNPDDCLACGS